MNVVKRITFKLIQYAGKRADNMIATFTIINEIDQMLNIISDVVYILYKFNSVLNSTMSVS